MYTLALTAKYLTLNPHKHFTSNSSKNQHDVKYTTDRNTIYANISEIRNCQITNFLLSIQNVWIYWKCVT